MAAESRHVSQRVASSNDGAPRISLHQRSSTKVEGALSLDRTDSGSTAVSVAALAEFAEALILESATSDDVAISPARALITSLTVNRLAYLVPGCLEGSARCIADGGSRRIFQVEIKQAGSDSVAAVITAQVELATADPLPAGSEPIKTVSEPPNESPPSRTHVDPEAASPASIRLRHLVDAASRVFATSGYGNASMREVAAEAAMPIATMYQYVSGKEQLLLFIFETYMSEILAALDRANDISTSPRERLRSCVGATLLLYEKYRAQIRLIHQEGRALGAENRARVRSLARSTRRIWEGILNAGVDRGEFRCTNPRITASLVPVLCSTWVLRRRALGNHTLDELRDAIVEMLEKGLDVKGASARARARRGS